MRIRKIGDLDPSNKTSGTRRQRIQRQISYNRQTTKDSTDASSTDVSRQPSLEVKDNSDAFTPEYRKQQRVRCIPSKDCSVGDLRLVYTAKANAKAKKIKGKSEKIKKIQSDSNSMD